jgi:hypothetical protein
MAKGRRCRSPLSIPKSSILAKRRRLTGSDFSVGFRFRLFGLQEYAPFERLARVFFGVLPEGLQQLSGCEMGLRRQANAGASFLESDCHDAAT